MLSDQTDEETALSRFWHVDPEIYQSQSIVPDKPAEGS